MAMAAAVAAWPTGAVNWAPPTPRHATLRDAAPHSIATITTPSPHHHPITCTMNGALMFMQYTLSFSAQCFAAAMIDSGDTVMKKPAE